MPWNLSVHHDIWNLSYFCIKRYWRYKLPLVSHLLSSYCRGKVTNFVTAAQCIIKLVQSGNALLFDWFPLLGKIYFYFLWEFQWEVVGVMDMQTRWGQQHGADVTVRHLMDVVQHNWQPQNASILKKSKFVKRFGSHSQKPYNKGLFVHRDMATTQGAQITLQAFLIPRIRAPKLVFATFPAECSKRKKVN